MRQVCMYQSSTVIGLCRTEKRAVTKMDELFIPLLSPKRWFHNTRIDYYMRVLFYRAYLDVLRSFRTVLYMPYSHQKERDNRVILYDLKR